MADETENLVLEQLRAIRSDIAEVRADVAAVKADVAAIKIEQRTQSRLLDILKQDGRLLRSAVNDLAKENVTPGEVEAIHQDLTQLQHDVVSLQVRMEALEGRDH
jgi:ubiquinone biosynthesis protein UbiJ